MITSTPRNDALGTDDQSPRALPSEDIRQPQHCPLFFLFTKKGEGQKFVTGNEFKEYFGAESLDATFPGYTLASKYASTAFGNANSCVIRRIVPADGKLQKANVTFFVELVKVSFNKQVRNSDGSLVFNTDGTPKEASPAVSIDGFVYRIITKETLGGTADYAITDGTWQPTGATEVSKIYPLVSLEASAYGSEYNKIGWVLSRADIDKEKVIDQNEMLFNLKRFDVVAGNPRNVKTSVGTDSVMFSLTPDAKDSVSNRFLDIPSTLIEAYQTETNTAVVNDLGVVKTYPTSYDALRALIATTEQPLINTSVETFDDGIDGINAEWYDYDYETLGTNITDVNKMFDFVGMSTTTNVVLQSVGNEQLDDEMLNNIPNGYKLASTGSTTPSYFEGGTDGTMNKATLEAGIITAMADYSDINSRVQSTALNPESNIWDCGFTIPTKLALSSFLSRRRDTIVNFTTEIEGVQQTDEDRLAIALILNNRMGLSPESDYFGTSVARYTISFGGGELADNSIKDIVGQNIDLLDKVSGYMGAGNGLWKQGKAFDVWPGSRVTLLKNIVPEEVAPGMRDVIWKSNCIFADPKNMKEHFITGAQTGYKDETSVLNSLLVIQAISYLVKLNDDAWREVSGSQRMSKLQLKERVEGFINKKIKDAFDNSFIVYPEVTFTEDDLIRNYAWHLNVHLGANGMMTRQTSHITTHRIEDLEGAN